MWNPWGWWVPGPRPTVIKWHWFFLRLGTQPFQIERVEPLCPVMSMWALDSVFIEAQGGYTQISCVWFLFIKHLLCTQRSHGLHICPAYVY